MSFCDYKLTYGGDDTWYSSEIKNGMFREVILLLCPSLFQRVIRRRHHETNSIFSYFYNLYINGQTESMGL